jgi:hypothetical protein
MKGCHREPEGAEAKSDAIVGIVTTASEDQLIRSAICLKLGDDLLL